MTIRLAKLKATADSTSDGTGLQANGARSLGRRDMALELETAAREAAERELKALSRRMITAQEEDRARIARDLHDDISQRLHAAAIGINQALLAMATDQDGATARLQATQQQLDDVADDARKISHELHPATLEILGLVPALEGLGHDFEVASGVTTLVSAPTCVRFVVTPAMSLCLYRITQEALHNIEKHGSARNVDVELSCVPGSVTLRLRDDGVGFDPATCPAGFGLASIGARVRMFDGTLTIDSTPGAGTMLVVQFPVPRDAL